MNLNTLYRLTFDRDSDDMGNNAYSDALKIHGAWHVYNILTKSEEYIRLIAKTIDNIASFHVTRPNNMKNIGMIPTIIMFDTEIEFVRICNRITYVCSPTLIIHASHIKLDSSRLSFVQKGKIAILLSGFSRFEHLNTEIVHENNTCDIFASYWKTVDIHGTNYSNSTQYINHTVDPQKYKCLSFPEITDFTIDNAALLLREESHILPRIKSMYNGIRNVFNLYDGNHDIVIRSRSDVRIFDFIDAHDGALWVNNKHIGSLEDNVVYIPFAHYKRDVSVITDMVALGTPTVMRQFANIFNLLQTAEGAAINIPKVPELILYEYFHRLGIQVVPFHLKYRLLRVIDFGETEHSHVYLGPLYGTCVVEHITGSKYVRIRNHNGQSFGHHWGVLSFSHIHHNDDDVFVVHNDGLYSTNLDRIFSLHMKENNVIYLSLINTTTFSFDAEKIPSYTCSKSNTDIVVSRFDENLEWCKPYASMCIVYNKGEPLINNCGLKIRHLPNVGRESHTYLNHIINNWDNLNEYTLFLQGGSIGHGQEQSHMFAGITVDDYVHAINEVFLLVSAQQDTDNMEHFLRDGYQGEPTWFGLIDSARFKTLNRLRLKDLCDTHKHWAATTDNTPIVLSPRGVLTYPDRRGASVMSFHWCQSFKTRFKKFWFDIFGTDCPKYLYYSQGAQFKIHRDIIKKRDISFYKKILSYVERSVNPPEGYFCELIWRYVFVDHR